MVTKSFSSTLASLITSGDVSGAETYFRGWCAGRTWAPAEASAIRSACSRWGVDPARFGVAPRRAPEPWTLAIRAYLTMDPIPQSATDGDFQTAAMVAWSRYPDPVPTWRMEAVRFRLHHPTAPLDVAAIDAATSSTLAMLARRCS